VTDAEPRLIDLPTDQMLAIDRACDRFERACQAGPAPSFDEYLTEVEGPARSALCRALEQLAGDYAARRAAEGQRRVGDYELREELGRGGMGVVYRATHRTMKRDVAFKTLRAEFRQDEQMRLRFAREIESAARLSHPNIVAAYDAGECDGVAHLVCELVTGEDLAHLVRRVGPLPVAQAIDCIAQAARGLDYAHRNGLVHRDVKPSNLIVDRAGVVKLLDLGLAREDQTAAGETSHSQRDLTGANDLAGTVGFMAPEQALRPRAADARSDIYSLGCTLFYLILGRAPYSGQTTLELLLAHRDQPIPQLASPQGPVPAPVSRLFARMVAKDPAARPQSMAEVAAALGAAEGAGRQVARTIRPTRWQAALTGCLVLGAGALWAAWGPSRPALRSGGTPQPVQAGLATAPTIRQFTSSEAADEQQRWADALELPIEIDIPAGPKLRLLPPGEFVMGTPAGELVRLLARATSDIHRDWLRTESPQRRVRIEKPFYLGATEVTVADFRHFVEATGYQTFAERSHDGYGWHEFSQAWQRDDGGKGYTWRNLGDLEIVDDLPVMNIAWGDAVNYCDWLSTEREGVPATLMFRLPWEREWEYAARAGSQAAWSFGDNPLLLREYAWTTDNARVPQRVGSRRPNAFGLFDMHGSLSEWCGDRLEERYDLLVPANFETRIKRGGGFSNQPAQTRSAARQWLHPSSPYGGFRVAAELIER
jgi:formylglycine-generating enzyme required for sulfatase activity